MLDSSPAVSLVLRKKYPKTRMNEPKMNVRISPEEMVASSSAAPTTRAMKRRVLFVLSLCWRTWALRSAISLDPRPAGTVRTFGSFSSS